MSDKPGNLVLSRAVNESVIIDDEIEVVIVAIEDGGRRVKLGFRAPRSRQIWRKEKWLEIQEENALASAVDPGDLEDLVG